MAKTAYLYTFCPRTRVVADPNDFADEQELFEHLTKLAREQMIDNGIDGYLFGDNGEYEEDTECPFGTFKEDK